MTGCDYGINGMQFACKNAFRIGEEAREWILRLVGICSQTGLFMWTYWSGAERAVNPSVDGYCALRLTINRHVKVVKLLLKDTRVDDAACLDKQLFTDYLSTRIYQIKFVCTITPIPYRAVCTIEVCCNIYSCDTDLI